MVLAAAMEGDRQEAAVCCIVHLRVHDNNLWPRLQIHRNVKVLQSLRLQGMSILFRLCSFNCRTFYYKVCALLFRGFILVSEISVVTFGLFFSQYKLTLCMSVCQVLIIFRILWKKQDRIIANCYYNIIRWNSIYNSRGIIAVLSLI